MNQFTQYDIACGGYKLKQPPDPDHFIELEHRSRSKNQNVKLSLNKITNNVYHLPARIKDLLEIAGYIFAADRKTYRGKPDDLEYHSWSRKFHFHFKVRDLKFWDNAETKILLNNALKFMTGDHSFEFSFSKAPGDFPVSIFDDEKFSLTSTANFKIVLFSGGLDSLAGIIKMLEETKDKLCLVSHQSGQSRVIRTQNQLYEAIKALYPGRCKHYKFRCSLTNGGSVDESQRTRSFLFTSIAFSIASVYKKESIDIFENGITSINFPETQDLMNARASRTTHPQTIGLLENFFSAVAGKTFKINHPFLFKTKTDIINIIKQFHKEDLIDSAVSCSTSRGGKGKTHCGVCSQCIDRRFAIYAAAAEKYDGNGIYDFDFLTSPLEKELIVKILNDYIRLAFSVNDMNVEKFYVYRGKEIADIEEYLPGTMDKKINGLYDLFSKHSTQIETSLNRMRQIYDSAYNRIGDKSFFKLILGERQYQQEPQEQISTIETVPPRKLKETALQAAQELADFGRITKDMRETKGDKEITKVLIPYLSRKYILSPENKRSLHLYFRRGDIRMKNKSGILTFVNMSAPKSSEK